MNLLIGTLTIAFILALLALGVYLSFKVLDFPDITVDGSITFGAAVAAVMIINHQSPVLASVGGAVAGAAAGVVTGVLHTRFRIHGLLAGILVMTALYSINLHVMGSSNIPLMSVSTVFGGPASASAESTMVNILGWDVARRDLRALGLATVLCVLIGLGLYAFLRTRAGSAMRATGENAQMMRALAVNTSAMMVLGLTISNALVGLSGALLAQYQGFADLQMGIGMVVWGLASVIIGESLVRSRKPGLALTGSVIGALVFRLMVSIALRFGLNPNDLKLITSVFVFLALTAPYFTQHLRRPMKGAPRHA